METRRLFVKQKNIRPFLPYGGLASHLEASQPAGGQPASWWPASQLKASQPTLTFHSSWTAWKQ